MYIHLIIPHTIQIGQTEDKITCALSESDANFHLNTQPLLMYLRLVSS